MPGLTFNNLQGLDAIIANAMKKDHELLLISVVYSLQWSENDGTQMKRTVYSFTQGLVVSHWNGPEPPRMTEPRIFFDLGGGQPLTFEEHGDADLSRYPHSVDTNYLAAALFID